MTARVHHILLARASEEAEKETLVLVSWIYHCTQLPTHLTDEGSADGEESDEVVPSDELSLVKLANIDRVWTYGPFPGCEKKGNPHWAQWNMRTWTPGKHGHGKKLVVCPSIALAFFEALMLIYTGYR